MLHVIPEYIVVVSNPAEIVVEEDESKTMTALSLRGYIAAKYTSLRVMATISPTGGIPVD